MTSTPISLKSAYASGSPLTVVIRSTRIKVMSMCVRGIGIEGGQHLDRTPLQDMDASIFVRHQKNTALIANGRAILSLNSAADDERK